MDQRLQVLRVVHAALLFACLLYVAVGELAGPKEPSDVKLLLIVIGFVAVTDVGIAMFLRSQFVGGAEEVLRRSPEDATALQRWTSGHMIALAMCEAVGIFGLVLRLLGATLIQVLPFYGACVLLMLMWTPRRPE